MFIVTVALLFFKWIKGEEKNHLASSSQSKYKKSYLQLTSKNILQKQPKLSKREIAKNARYSGEGKLRGLHGGEICR